MGRSADTAWAPEVKKMLHHNQTSVQIEAVRAAGELELEATRRIMLQMLDDELQDSDLRSAIYWSLSKIGGDDVRETLELRLEETEDDEEAEALEDALANLDFTEEIGLLNLMDIDDVPQEDEDPQEYLLTRNARVLNLEEEEEETDTSPPDKTTQDEPDQPE
jgi:HEAT repeat protein